MQLSSGAEAASSSSPATLLWVASASIIPTAYTCTAPPPSYASTLTLPSGTCVPLLCTWCCREGVLQQLGYRDIFKACKDTENAAALELLPKVGHKPTACINSLQQTQQPSSLVATLCGVSHASNRRSSPGRQHLSWLASCWLQLCHGLRHKKSSNFKQC